MGAVLPLTGFFVSRLFFFVFCLLSGPCWVRWVGEPGGIEREPNMLFGVLMYIQWHFLWSLLLTFLPF